MIAAPEARTIAWPRLAAEPFTAPDTEGRPWTLADRRGKNVLLLLYLGGSCPHCVEQLKAVGKEIEAFRKLDTEVVGVGNEDLEVTRALKNNADGVSFPMPLLSDPDLTIFRSYRAVDDFEDRPMHATILIDSRGEVRYQKISAEPFMDVEFLKSEVARVNRLTRDR